ncbi:MULTISPECIES: 2-C-methyl-D-erythritol 4-phosphate cytidylyltransferase [Halomonadaceae]|uniref:2-C-methyl-D-erythritol 4-phosphate cytidylyltransferase n=2 Tax=Vreelandella maris TaxID=2729617 RepID=A0A7Y6RF00_9GAMM|nr:2-C-methyl-D-erythritol 4-phosphate cytidylyltransferase [Halomonas sp. MES3-P3E]NVF15727.1 2-C-methyl-D-erythritol 4-phosphate cytidylyltransferase [Halomonas maris]PKG54681.1 2-C-methyl-D-erythritol 4-phosphate cytidylyltransferase [Halomonas sp. MES3-P3E]
MSQTWLIVPAAGQGRRMGADKPKQYLTLADEQPVLAHTLARLHHAFPHARLVLCLDADDRWFSPGWVPFADWQRVPGGNERMDSVLNALHAMAAEGDDVVMVHDVARPCITVNDLQALYQAASTHPAGALLAMPVADTMKRADNQSLSSRTEPRDGLWHALTPQGFRYALLRRALETARQQQTLVTDEASAVEALGERPQLVSGRRDNLKITHPDDLALAAAIMAAQAANLPDRL